MTRTAEDNAAAAAAPRPMRLGSQVLLISPPTVSDNAAISLACKKHARAQTPYGMLVSDPAWEKLPEEAKVRAVALATPLQVQRPELSGADWMEALGQPDALAFAVWLLARRNHPKLTPAAVRQEVTDDNAPAVLVLFLEASGMLELGPEGNSGGRRGSTPESSTPPASTAV